MKLPSKIAAGFSVCAIGIFLLASYKIQNYRIQKVDFILRDRTHKNIANLTEPELIHYLEGCGAKVIKVQGELSVSYKGVFAHKNWTVKLEEKAEQNVPSD